MENQIIQAIQSISCPALDFIFQAITLIGEQYLLTFLALYILWCHDKNKGLNFIYIVVFSAFTNNIIKGIVKRPRPNFDGIIKLRNHSATGYSFPSGHSQNISTLLSGVYLTFKQHLKKSIFIPMAIIIFLLVGLSRIYLGAHYPTDVIGGLLFGLLFSIIADFIFKKVKNKSKLFFFTCIILIPFAIYFYIMPITDSLQNMTDFFKMFGLLLGIALAYFLEEHYIKYKTDDLSLKNKTLRFIVGIIIVAIAYIPFKIILPHDYIFSLIRYFLVSFTAMFIVPFIFKALKI